MEVNKLYVKKLERRVLILEKEIGMLRTALQVKELTYQRRTKMDGYEARAAALGMARELLGKEASLQDILDLAWELSSFIIEGWTFKEIETEFVEST